MFLISQAFAQETVEKASATAQKAAEAFITSGAAGTSPAEPPAWVTIAPIVLVFIIFYVLFIMPQNKRIREHQAAIKAMQKGDKVVTGGGTVAKISKIINDDEIELEIASGVNITVLRHTIVGPYVPAEQKKHIS